MLRPIGRRFTVATLVLAALVGTAAGAAGYTFLYAKGAAYMTNDPTACANCHVMNEQYDGWVKSSHKHVAVCNDCHAPHDNVVNKYFTKALNGWNHSSAFTTGNFPDPIRITERNRRITEGACRHCHGDIVGAIAARPMVQGAGAAGGAHGGTDSPARAGEVSCIRCHRDAGHAHGG
jgi:cytochrome c nitrite reductase small subunit